MLQLLHLFQRLFLGRVLLIQKVEGFPFEQPVQACSESQRMIRILDFGYFAFLLEISPQRHQQRVLVVEDEKVFQRTGVPQENQRPSIALNRQIYARPENLLEHFVVKICRLMESQNFIFGQAAGYFLRASNHSKKCG